MLGRIPPARQAIIDRIAARARRKRRKGLPVAPDRLARYFYHGVSELDLVQRTPEDLAGAALAVLELGLARRGSRSLVRVFNPDLERDGFASPHTVIMVVTDDKPFLVDSLGMVCTQTGLAVHLLAHPVLSVVRDRRGRLKSVYLDDPPPGTKFESWQMIEIDREPDPARLALIEASIRRSLEDVRAATGDWRRMRAKAAEAAAALGGARPRGHGSEVREAKALLEWMEDNHFTFLGYREYRLRRGPRKDRLVPLPRSSLGIMRSRTGRKPKTITLSGEVRAFARSAEPLVITKANSVATVHRSTYLDYVGVKTFDAKGNVSGELRFLGLWTSSAYSMSPYEIPVLRHKVQRVIDHFRLNAASHDHKALVHALETFPRDELFQATVPDLVRILRGIVNLYERAQVRLFVRRDPFRRFYSCLVYVPRDRYNTQARKRIEQLALEAFGGVAIESQVTLSESVLARLHMLVRTPPTAEQGVDAVELERRISETVRTWQDQLKDALLDAHGEAEALRLNRVWGDAFPAAYQEDMPFETAVGDIALLERVVASPGELHMGLYRRADQPAHKFQFKILRKDRPIPISDVLPTIENLGLKLISERPYDIGSEPGAFWIQDFELEHPRGVRIDLESDGPRFMTTFAHVWAGDVDNDGFNRLVLAADLDWREAMVLRTYARWFVQLGLPLSQTYVEEALASNAAAAGHLLRLFVARFDPGIPASQRRRAETAQRRALDRLLARVTRIDDDRILRAFLAAIEATLRTNYFQVDAAGRPRPYLALKLDPRQLAEVPLPKPMFEIFVHSPARRGRAPAHGPRRARRPALVRPARGLPHRDPRADEGAERQEHRDRPGRRQGRLRPAPPAAEPRRGAAGGHGVLPHLHPRASRRDRQRRRRQGRGPAPRRAARRRRRLPGRRGRQGHGEVLRRRQCDLGGLRVLARRRLRVRRLRGIRPQGHGHHGARRLGVGAAALPRARPRHAGAGLHGLPASATCQATCSATPCCCRSTSACSRPSTTATSSSTPRRTRPPASPSAGACSRCRGRAGRTTTRAWSRRAAACTRGSRSRSRCRPRPAPCSASTRRRPRRTTSSARS